jgi:branched-chain amino acid transport system substrate-binding protein
MNKSYLTRRARVDVWIAGIAVATLGLTSCSNPVSGSQSKGLKAGAPIVIASLEAPATSGGPDFTSGMRVAAERINAEGGIDGRKIEVKIFKQDGTPSGIVNAYRAAAADPTVIGGMLGVAGTEIKRLSDQVKLPVATSGGAEEITNPPAKYIFDTTFTTEYAGSALAHAMQTNRGVKRIAVLHYDTAYSQSVEASVRKNCEQFGCEVVAVESSTSAASTDEIVPQLTKLREAKPDAYYIEGLNPNGWKAVRQLGIKDPIVSEQWLAVPAIAGACAENCAGVPFAAHKCRYNGDWEQLNSDDPVVEWCKGFVADWEKANPGADFPIFSIYGYDAVAVLAEAVKQLAKAGKAITRDGVAGEMANFDGVPFTSTGVLHSSPENHKLTGNWSDGYVMTVVKPRPGGKVGFALAEGADPSGAPLEP